MATSTSTTSSDSKLEIAKLVASLFAAGLGGANAGKVSDKQLQQQRDLANQNVALQESGMDPFRQQVQQASALGKLDLMERSRYTPVSVTGASRYASSVPQRTGGFSYEMDPAVRTAAGTLKGSVMAGNTAPTMTNKANYGKTAAMNLTPQGTNVYGSNAANYGGPSINDLGDKRSDLSDSSRSVDAQDQGMSFTYMPGGPTGKAPTQPPHDPYDGFGPDGPQDAGKRGGMSKGAKLKMALTILSFLK